MDEQVIAKKPLKKYWGLFAFSLVLYLIPTLFTSWFYIDVFCFSTDQLGAALALVLFWPLVIIGATAFFLVSIILAVIGLVKTARHREKGRAKGQLARFIVMIVLPVVTEVAMYFTVYLSSLFSSAA